MSVRTAVRVAGAVLIGLWLGTLPFFRSGTRHHHDGGAPHHREGRCESPAPPDHRHAAAVADDAPAGRVHPPHHH